MKKIIAIIQARIGSRRLASKVLLKIESKAILEHVIGRVKRSRLIDEVVMATTVLAQDLKIVDLCLRNKIRVYCGSEEDCLDRYYQAARLFEAGHIVRITADCPLIDPDVIDKVVRLHLTKKSDYASNVIKLTFPDGEDVEVFTFPALEKAWKRAKLGSEREHVTAYIRKHPKIFKLASLELKENLSEKRWTLDEEKDYRFIKLIYGNLYRVNRVFGMDEILAFLKDHPEYEKINSGIKRNQGYLKSLRRDNVSSG